MAAVTPALRTPPLEVTVHTGLAGLEEVREAWEQAAAGMERRRYFHDIRWYQSYLEVLERDPRRVHFFTFRAAGRPVAVLPLRRSKVSRAGIPVRVLEIPFHQYLSFGDFIIAEGQDLPALARTLLATLRADPRFGWDVLRLPYVLEDARALALIRCMQGFLIQQWRLGDCDYLPCPSGNNPVERCSKNLRSQLRKSSKRLDALGPNGVDTYREGTELERAFQTFLDIEASGWKGRAGTAIKSIPEKERIFRRLFELFSASGQLQIDLLQLNGQSIGGDLTIWMDDTVYDLKIARDQAFDEVSPGHLLTRDLLSRCSENERVRYLNLVSDTEWHSRWRPEKYRIDECHLCNWTIGGLAQYAALARARFRKRKLATRRE